MQSHIHMAIITVCPLPELGVKQIDPTQAHSCSYSSTSCNQAHLIGSQSHIGTTNRYQISSKRASAYGSISCQQPLTWRRMIARQTWHTTRNWDSTTATALHKNIPQARQADAEGKKKTSNAATQDVLKHMYYYWLIISISHSDSE